MKHVCSLAGLSLESRVESRVFEMYAKKTKNVNH